MLSARRSRKRNARLPSSASGNRSATSCNCSAPASFCRLESRTAEHPANGSRKRSGIERLRWFGCLGLPCQAMPILKPAMPLSSWRQLPLVLQHVAQVVVYPGGVRLQFQCPAVAGDRFVQLPLLLQRIAKVVVSRRNLLTMVNAVIDSTNPEMGQYEFCATYAAGVPLRSNGLAGGVAERRRWSAWPTSVAEEGACKCQRDEADHDRWRSGSPRPA